MWTLLISNRKATAGAVLLMIFCVLAAVPGLFASHAGTIVDAYPPNLGVSGKHLLGTTSLGQDIFAQVVWSTRDSLEIALLVGALSTVLAVIIGVTAGFIGGLGDSVLSMFTDVFLVIPTFPLIIVLAAYFKHSGTNVVVFILVVTGWSYGARQLRVQTMSLRNRDFLEAARVRGERGSYIIVAEILPTISSLIVASFLGAALFAVLAAAGLQFVGLGDPNSESWGTMLYWAQQQEALQTGSPLWAIVPGACIALLGAAFALLNYAFDEISNPALRPIRRTHAPSRDARP
jgi:peptide/nickel transport system permease protein